MAPRCRRATRSKCSMIWPLQVLVAKARKEPIRGPVPVQRAPIVLEPCKRSKHVEGAVPQVGARVASRGVQGHTVSGVVP